MFTITMAYRHLSPTAILSMKYCHIQSPFRLWAIIGLTTKLRRIKAIKYFQTLINAHMWCTETLSNLTSGATAIFVDIVLDLVVQTVDHLPMKFCPRNFSISADTNFLLRHLYRTQHITFCVLLRQFTFTEIKKENMTKMVTVCFHFNLDVKTKLNIFMELYSTPNNNKDSFFLS